METLDLVADVKGRGKRVHYFQFVEMECLFAGEEKSVLDIYLLDLHFYHHLCY